MVEVDVFWSYGIGAGFAFASGRHARNKPFKESTFESTHFRDTLLFLACAFAPSGIALVWAFPDWETMHLGTRDMPHWLVALFAATNVTQGVLGFGVTRWLLSMHKPYAAYLQWFVGYFAMFFILVHGWDGSGFMRFFSPTSADLPGWTWSTAARWLTSPVAQTLYVEGLFIVPPILLLTARWVSQGWALTGRPPPLSQGLLSAQVLFFSIIVLPATAIGASVLIRQLGWFAGMVVFALMLYVIGLRRGGVYHRHFRQLHEGAGYFSSPAQEHPVSTPAAA